MPNSIDRAEVLRYLGYSGQEIDDIINDKISVCIEKMLKLAVPRYVYRIFDLRSGDESVTLTDAELLLDGRDICNHLRDCDRCAVMAATLGVAVDNAIRVAEAADMTEAVIMDACATAYIEQICDQSENEIASLAAVEGREITSRFSPGYGDLPLDVQTGLLAVLDTQRKIGLTATENALLLPRKSVTALIGFTNQTQKKTDNRCEVCSMRGECRFRKDGTTCGH